MNDPNNNDNNNNMNDNKDNKDINNDNIETFNKIFDEILKKNNNSLKFKNEFKPLSKMSKRSQIIKKDDEKNKSNILNNDNNNQHKIPVEFELYKEAKTRKEKKEKMEYNNMMNILLNAQKVKISNNSHKIAINKIEREIDETIAKYENNNQISFIDAGKILADLKFFREMFKDDISNNNNAKKNNNNKLHKKIQSYKDIQHELLTQKEKEERKQKEINFYEQLWLIINPNNIDFIKTDIFFIIFNIFFHSFAIMFNIFISQQIFFK